MLANGIFSCFVFSRGCGRVTNIALPQFLLKWANYFVNYREKIVHFNFFQTNGEVQKILEKMHPVEQFTPRNCLIFFTLTMPEISSKKRHSRGPLYGNGRPYYTSQLLGKGFIGKVCSPSAKDLQLRSLTSICYQHHLLILIYFVIIGLQKNVHLKAPHTEIGVYYNSQLPDFGCIEVCSPL